MLQLDRDQSEINCAKIYLIPFNFRAPSVFAHLPCAKIRGSNFVQDRCAKFNGSWYYVANYRQNSKLFSKKGATMCDICTFDQILLEKERLARNGGRGRRGSIISSAIGIYEISCRMYFTVNIMLIQITFFTGFWRKIKLA